MDLQRILTVLRRWWPILLVGTLLAAAVAYGVTKTRPTAYAATAVLQVYPGVAGDVAGGDYNEQQAAWNIAQMDAQLLRTGSLAQATLRTVGSKLHHPIDAGTLLANTTASAGSQSTLINLTVTSRDPADATLLADAMARAFVAQDTGQRSAVASTALTGILRKMQQYSLDENAAQKAPPAIKYQRIATDQAMLASLGQAAAILQTRQNAVGPRLAVAQSATVGAISPRTTVMTVVAAVLAFLVLSGVALLTDYLDTRPRNAREIAAILGLPLLATLRATKPGRSAIAVVSSPATPLSDDYRGLRANLEGHLGRPHDRPIMLAVTGCRSGVGASTAAINIAAAAARSGIRVVLVDGNVRRPMIHSFLGLTNTAGLSTVLKGDESAVALLQESVVPDLRVLTAGPASDEAIDVLGSGRVHAGLRDLGEATDLIVIDVGPADRPDAVTLAAQCDSTLLVERLVGASRAVLSETVERLRLAEARPVGVAVVLSSTTSPSRTLRKPSAIAVTPTDVERTTGTAPSTTSLG